MSEAHARTAPRTAPIAIDLETHLIQPGILAPPIVCGSSADDQSSRLLSVSDVRAEFPEVIATAELLIGANIAYDFGCLAADDPALLDLIFDAYSEDRVLDVLIAPALDAIGRGHLFKDPRTGGKLREPGLRGKVTDRYSLAIVSDLVLGRVDAKIHDFWRLRYAILEGVPLEEWPEEARIYPRDDVRNTYDVGAEIVRRHRAGEWLNLHDQPWQARAAWAMHLACMWGTRTDPVRVGKLSARVEAEHAELIEKFKAFGFIRENGKGNQSAVKTATAIAYGAVGACAKCGGTGKVPSPKTGKPVICKTSVVEGGDDSEPADVEADEEGAPRVTCATCEGDGAGIGEDPACLTCEGEGTVPYRAPSNLLGCDGTGLDLSTAPGLPRAAKGGISISRDNLAESGDDNLEEFGHVSEVAKLKNTYLPVLLQGVDTPINFRANIIVASGRTSYSGIIQLVPRGGGVRWCFVPRIGWLYCSIDYSAIELCTLAQAQLWICGSSSMADLINASGDPGSLHTAFAAKMVGIDFAELKKRVDAGDPAAAGFRYAAKAANFGFPGGMSASTLVLAKRKRIEGETPSPDYRVEGGRVVSGVAYAGIRFCILIGGEQRCGTHKVTEWKRKLIPPACVRCLECAEDLRVAWFQQWPEMPEFFTYVKRELQSASEITQFVSERVRGGLTFCNGANTLFQGLAADGAKRGLWNVARESYTRRLYPEWERGESPLYNRARTIFFNHDEIFPEIREEGAHETAFRVSKIWVDSMREVVPDVTVTAEPALMRRWDKNAKTVYDAAGRLAVWEPKIACSNCGHASKGYELTCPTCGTYTELSK